MVINGMERNLPWGIDHAPEHTNRKYTSNGQTAMDENMCSLGSPLHFHSGQQGKRKWCDPSGIWSLWSDLIRVGTWKSHQGDKPITWLSHGWEHACWESNSKTVSVKY